MRYICLDFNNLGSTKTKYDEATLVKLLKSKEKEAFSYLYENYSSVLYGVIMKVMDMQEEANDVLQDAFVKIWRNIESYDTNKGRLYTWMLNIARNTAIDYLRSKQHKNESKNQNIEDSVYTINRSVKVEQQTDAIGVKQLIGKLPDEQRKVIELVYFKGYTQDEASKELEIPLGTVKTRVRAAIGTLRKVFK
ncbi:MAG: RNA polymerase sigma factor [Bacteroidia bacterium]|nr:RNA polymerase sigma factor [Bacteroidia bacterium]